jgi:hypothetical protein
MELNLNKLGSISTSGMAKLRTTYMYVLLGIVMATIGAGAGLMMYKSITGLAFILLVILDFENINQNKAPNSNITSKIKAKPVILLYIINPAPAPIVAITIPKRTYIYVVLNFAIPEVDMLPNLFKFNSILILLFFWPKICIM